MENQDNKPKFKSFFDNNSNSNVRQANDLQKQIVLLEKRVKLLEEKIKKGSK